MFHLLPQARALIRVLVADAARTREYVLGLNEEMRRVVLDLLAASAEPVAVLAFAEALAILPASALSRAYLPTLFARLSLGNGAEPTHRAWQAALPLLLGLLLVVDEAPELVGMLFVQALAARPPRDIRWQLDALICRLPPPWPGLCDESQTF